ELGVRPDSSKNHRTPLLAPASWGTGVAWQGYIEGWTLTAASSEAPPDPSRIGGHIAVPAGLSDPGDMFNEQAGHLAGFSLQDSKHGDLSALDDDRRGRSA